MGLRLRAMSLILLFFIHFFSFPILQVNIIICVRVFSGIVEARMLKLGIHMDNELYCGIENRTYRSHYSSFLSIFLSFPILHVNIRNLCQSFLRYC